MSIYIKLPHIFQIYRYILLDISLVGIIRYIQPQNHHDISQHIGIYRVFQDIFQYIANISRYIAIYCFYFWRYITKIYRYIVKNDNDISRYMSIYRDISWYIAIYCLSGQNVAYTAAFLMAIYNRVPRGLWAIPNAEIVFLTFSPENRKNLGSPPPT